MGIGATLKEALGISAPANLVGVSGLFDSPTQLTQIVISDLLPNAAVPVTRAEAMRVPSLRKARNLICATIAAFPIKAARGDVLLPQKDQPAWMYADDDPVSPFMRMLWTADDLLFYDISVWRVWRGTQQPGSRYAPILKAQRVPMHRWAWKADADGVQRIHVDDVPMDDDEVVVFDGPIGLGLIDGGSTQIRAARDIDRSVASRATSAGAAWYLEPSEELDMDDDEKRDLARDFDKARKSPEGGVIIGDHRIKVNELGAGRDGAVALTEARNGARLDMANLTGVPVALLDGSTSTASLTYSTQEGRRNEFVDYSLTVWIEAMQGRLSAADVLPQGQRAVLDRTDFYAMAPSPLGVDHENETPPAPTPDADTPIRQETTA